MKKAALILLFVTSVIVHSQVVKIDDCDSAGQTPNNWRGSMPVRLNEDSHISGTGCLETQNGVSPDIFRKLFADPIDLTHGGEVDVYDGELKFWFYVSNPELLTSENGQIELGSGGQADQLEVNWNFSKDIIKEGWNEYSFPLSNSSVSGGAPDFNSINWFRIYKQSEASSIGEMTYRIDDLRIDYGQLPVVIDSFSLLEENNIVKLEWHAKSGELGTYFSLEHAHGNSDFSEIGMLELIAGDNFNNYSIEHNDPQTGINHYRIAYYSEGGQRITLDSKYIMLTAEIAQSITGKLIAGYQGWFNCYGDGSPVDRWVHWSRGVYRSNSGRPEPGHLTFETYPDNTEYEESSLFQTGFAPLGDGSNAELFSSYKKDVINKHLEWMQTYGVEGLALQRFLSETKDGVFKRNRDTIAVRIKSAAEKYQRLFYIMYDMDAGDPEYFKSDWEHMEENLQITESPYYAKQDGKPVICIWGFGFSHRPSDPENSLEIIEWLKSKGYYVVGGVPTNWRTGVSDSHSGYMDVYNALDMISPWSVGRFGNTTGADNFKANFLIPDFEHCNIRGIEYQPVMFPGFAWSNWYAGYEERENQIPRNRGAFFWRQLNNIKSLNINNGYIAMFDEFDEATNILKAADSYFTIPTDQYFLTYSADGTYLSSDFYLRLAGKANEVMKDELLLSDEVPIRYSEGPVWFRTSLEKGFDAEVQTPNKVLDSQNVSPASPSLTLRSEVVFNEERRSGYHSIKYEGYSTAVNSYCDFEIFEVDITIGSQTHLSYWMFPENEMGQYISIDFLFRDGSRLSDIEVYDFDGYLMHSLYPRGVINEWTRVVSNLGQWLEGKTIKKIIISYKNIDKTGVFSGYIDDIIIVDTDQIALSNPDLPKNDEKAVVVYPTYVTGGEVFIDLKKDIDFRTLVVQIFDLNGILVALYRGYENERKYFSVRSLPDGFYIVVITGNGIHKAQRILINSR